uniref:Uncharacterized protein n=1 Tax=Tetradesmus obliquus TaxID=3088 RepID=A0A383VUV1_TETOB|eukprot:jgi/Sobl393_1/14884/SZX68544.1
MGHMKLVVIIGCAISAGGVVLIAGLSMLDCCFNSRPAAVADESTAYSQAQARSQQPWDAAHHSAMTAGAPAAGMQAGVNNRARGRAW